MSQATRGPPFARRLAVLLVGLAMGLGTGFVRAEADGPDYFAVRGVARGDVLNIRAEPDPHARKVGEIPPEGACIRNLGCRGGLTFEEFTTLAPAEKERRTREHPRWCKVEYGVVTGWVAGHYLAEWALPPLSLGGHVIIEATS